MKKILNLIGLFSIVLLLSCQNEENSVQEIKGTGDLVAKIAFDISGSSLRKANSTAIPVTNWDNVKSMQLFLYYPESATNNGAKVAFSAIIDPTSVADGATKTFKWTNVPEGTYDLAIVANIDSNTQNISTSLSGGTDWTQFTPYNVRGKKINSEIYIDLKKAASFPTGHNFPATRTGYAPSAEIFTAYASDIKIKQGTEVVLSGTTALKLKREVSLMRILIDKTDKSAASQLSQVDFANAANFIAVQILPVGIGMKLGEFSGGIYDKPSDENRIMIAASGTDTYNTSDPTSGYNPSKILGGNYTLWKDIMVLPNATKADGKIAGANSDAARRYTVIIAGRVPKDYKYADGTVASANNSPVYWAGSIKGVFLPNTIREVTLAISSPGEPVIPEPQKDGSLTIEVGVPENWDSNISYENLDI